MAKAQTKSLQELLAGKKFGLVLSAGFFGFYGHAGFVKGLFATGLSPAAYAGTSAGGLVAAFAAAGASVEAIEELVLTQTRKSFWDPDPIGALAAALRGGHGATGLLKGDRFRRLLEEKLPVSRIEDCEKPLTLVGTNLTTAAPENFLSGALSPRVHATCAYPGLFRAAEVEGKLYWDGGLIDKAPALALWETRAKEAGLEALLIHYLPSRTRKVLAGPLAYTQGMAASMAAVRREHFRLQLVVLEKLSVPTYVVVSTLPPVSPTSMERGFDALDQGRLSAQRALSRPPEPFEVS